MKWQGFSLGCHFVDLYSFQTQKNSSVHTTPDNKDTYHISIFNPIKFHIYWKLLEIDLWINRLSYLWRVKLFKKITFPKNRPLSYWTCFPVSLITSGISTAISPGLFVILYDNLYNELSSYDRCWINILPTVK